jgi:hypothetical protein
MKEFMQKMLNRNFMDLSRLAAVLAKFSGEG